MDNYMARKEGPAAVRAPCANCGSRVLPDRGSALGPVASATRPERARLISRHLELVKCWPGQMVSSGRRKARPHPPHARWIPDTPGGFMED